MPIGWSEIVAGETAHLLLRSVEGAMRPAHTPRVRFRAAIEMGEDGGANESSRPHIDVPVTERADLYTAVGGLSPPAFELSFIAPLASDGYRLHVWLHDPDAKASPPVEMAAGCGNVSTTHLVEHGGASHRLVPLEDGPFPFRVHAAMVNAAACVIRALGDAGPSDSAQLKAAIRRDNHVQSNDDAGGGGIQGASGGIAAGLRGTLRLELRDAFGNAVKRAAAVFAAATRVVLLPASDATGSHQGEGEALPIECTIELDTSDDTALLACFVAARAGTYVAHGWVQGKPIATRAPCRVHPAPLCVSACTLSGAGLRTAVSGVRGGFEIHARDSFGNLLGVGGLNWRVQTTVDGAGVAAGGGGGLVGGADGLVVVHDRHNGIYHVGYTLSASGRYKLRIELMPPTEGSGATTENDEDAGSLLYARDEILVVSPAPIDPNACVATLPAVLTAGSYGFGFVHARDASGNELPPTSLRDGLRARLVLDEPDTDIARSAGGDGPAGRGSEDVLLHDDAQRIADEILSWSPDVDDPATTMHRGARIAVRTYTAGRHLLHVRVNGEAISGSPMPVEVQPAPTHPSSCAMIFGALPPSDPPPPLPSHPPQLLVVPAGCHVHARLVTHDKFANRRRAGGDLVRLLVSSPRRVSAASVHDHNDGTYTCSFDAADAGAVEAYLSVNGLEVPISLKAPVHVRPAAPSLLRLYSSSAVYHQPWPTAMRVHDAVPSSGLGPEPPLQPIKEDQPPIVTPLHLPIDVRIAASDSHGNMCTIDPAALTARVMSEAETAVDDLVAAALVAEVSVYEDATMPTPTAVVLFTPSTVGTHRLEVSLAEGVVSAVARFEVMDVRVDLD